MRKKLLSSYQKTIEEGDFWLKVPVTGKKDISSNGTPKQFSELRITSGSTGEPLYMFYSKEAVNAFIERTRVSLEKSGVTKQDVVLNLFAYGNYVPGSMYEKACQIDDIAVLPLGAPNTYPKEKVVDCICKIKPSVWLSVPSYALGLLNILDDLNLGCKPEKIIVAGEKLLDSYLQRFNEHGVRVFNNFGLTECPAVGFSKEDNQSLIEVINDGIYVEAVDNDGKFNLVITDLNNFSTPIIRYNTGDVISDLNYNEDGSLKSFLLVGRDDDLVKLQGILTSKSKIVDTLSKFTDIFTINIKTQEDRDLLEIIIDDELKGVEKEIMQSLSFVLCKKDFKFSGEIEIPKTISNKVKHITDLRK